jgi:hypothetical protein
MAHYEAAGKSLPIARSTESNGLLRKKMIGESRIAGKISERCARDESGKGEIDRELGIDRMKRRAGTSVPIHEIHLSSPGRWTLVTGAFTARATFDILLRFEIAELFGLLSFLNVRIFFLV